MAKVRARCSSNLIKRRDSQVRVVFSRILSGNKCSLQHLNSNLVSRKVLNENRCIGVFAAAEVVIIFYAVAMAEKRQIEQINAEENGEFKQVKEIYSDLFITLYNQYLFNQTVLITK